MIWNAMTEFRCYDPIENPRETHMNKVLKAAFAAFLVAGMSQAAHAQIIGDQNTSVTGDAIYVEEDNVAYEQVGNSGLTISGALGLPLNPTARIPAKGSSIVQANYFDLFSAETTDASLYGLYAATRLGDAPVELSVGIERLSADNDVLDIDRTGFALGIKYLVTGDNDTDPEAVRVAVGAGYSSALYKNKHVYAVATKAFSAGTRVVTGHIGARYDRFSINGLDLDSSKVSFYGGLEVPIDRRGHFNLVGEVGTKNANTELGGASPYSLSLRYQGESGLAVSAGIARQGVTSNFTNDSGGRLFAQVGKTF